MSIKTLAPAALLGGITIFVWGLLVHMVLIPDTIRSFKDSRAVMSFVDAQAHDNGAYSDPQGAFMTVARTPGNSERVPTSQTLSYELLTNILQAIILGWILMRVSSPSIRGYARLAAMIGMTAFVAIDLSNWNWYGFPPSMTMQSMVDGVGGSFLAGAVIGWYQKEWAAKR